MGRKITFDETLAFKLYNEQKNDREISEIMGLSPETIRSWRKRRNLPNIANIKRPQDNCAFQLHQNYKDALTPKQSQEMERFLRALSWAGRKAVQSGVKPDVGHFMDVWSGRKKNREEWKNEQNWRRRVAQR